MTPEQRIKREILIEWSESLSDEEIAGLDGHEPITVGTDAETVDALFSELQQEWKLSDYVSEFREGGQETDLPKEWSRHYESMSVAAELSDGTWVGWTYWYGGGKHGEPGAIDWMCDAYEVAVVERKMVEVLVFAKVEDEARA